MADDEPLSDDGKKKSKVPLLVGVLLMLGLGGGGFFAVYSGLLLAPAHVEDNSDLLALEAEPLAPLPDVSFVPIEPLIINLETEGLVSRHLRFHAQLEVPSGFENEVNSLMPRIVDILNGYLRAVDVAALEHPAALVRLRAQILRRLQVVAGEGRVNDVLIMEFVIT